MSSRRERQVLHQGYNPYGETDYSRYATPLEARRALRWTTAEINEALRPRRKRRASHRKTR